MGESIIRFVLWGKYYKNCIMGKYYRGGVMSGGIIMGIIIYTILRFTVSENSSYWQIWADQAENFGKSKWVVDSSAHPCHQNWNKRYSQRNSTTTQYELTLPSHNGFHGRCR